MVCRFRFLLSFDKDQNMNDNRSNDSMEYSRSMLRRSPRTVETQFYARHKKYWVEVRRMSVADYDMKYVKNSKQGSRMKTTIRYNLYKLYLAFRTRRSKQELLDAGSKWPLTRGKDLDQKRLSCEVGGIGHRALFKTFRHDFGYDNDSAVPFDFSQFNTLPLVSVCDAASNKGDAENGNDDDVNDDDVNGESDGDATSSADGEASTTSTCTPTTLEALLPETCMSGVSACVRDEAVDLCDTLNSMECNIEDALGDVAKSLVSDIQARVAQPQCAATSQKHAASSMTRTALLGENGQGKSFFLNALLRASSLTPYEYERGNAHDTDALEFEGAVMLEKLLEAREGQGAHELVDVEGQVRDAVEDPPESVMDKSTGLFVLHNEHYAGILEKEKSIEAAIRTHATGNNARHTVGHADGSGAYVLPSQAGTASTTRCPIAVRAGRRFEAVVEHYSIDDLHLNCTQIDWEAVEAGEVKETSVFSSGKRTVDMIRRAMQPPSSCSYPNLSNIDGSDVVNDAGTSSSDVNPESSEATATEAPVTMRVLDRCDVDDTVDDAIDDTDSNCDLDLTPAPRPIDRALIDRFKLDPRDVVHPDRIHLLGKHRLLRTLGKNLVHDRLYLRETLKTLLDDEDALFFKRITVFVPSSVLREWNTELVDAPGCNDSDAQKVSTLAEVLNDSDHIIVVCPQRLLSCKSLASVIHEHLVAPHFENDLAGTGFPLLSFVWYPEKDVPKQLDQKDQCDETGERNQWAKLCWEDLKTAVKKVVCSTAEVNQDQEARERRILKSLKHKVKFLHAFPLLFSSLVTSTSGASIDDQLMTNIHNTGVPEVLRHIHTRAQRDTTLHEHSTARMFLAILEKYHQTVVEVEKTVQSESTLAATVGGDNLPIARKVQELLGESSAHTPKKNRLLATPRHIAAMYEKAEEVLTTHLVQDRQIDDNPSKYLAQDSKAMLFHPFFNACNAWTMRLMANRPPRLVALSRSKAAENVKNLFYTGNLDSADGVTTLYRLLMDLDRDCTDGESLAGSVFDNIKGIVESFERKVLGQMVASAIDEVLVAQIVEVEDPQENLRSVAEKMVELQTQGTCGHGRQRALEEMASVLKNFQERTFFGAYSKKEVLCESITRAVNQHRKVARERLQKAERQGLEEKETLCAISLELIVTAIRQCLPVIFSEHLVTTYHKHTVDIEICKHQSGLDMRRGKGLARCLRLERNRLIRALAHMRPDELPEDAAKKLGDRCLMMLNLVDSTKKKVEELEKTKNMKEDMEAMSSVQGMVRGMVVRAQLRRSWTVMEEDMRKADQAFTRTLAVAPLELILARTIAPPPSVLASSAVPQVTSHVSCSEALVKQVCDMAKKAAQVDQGEAGRAGPSTSAGVVSERTCPAGWERMLKIERGSPTERLPLMELCVQMTKIVPGLLALWQTNDTHSVKQTLKQYGELVAIRLATMVHVRSQRYEQFVLQIACALGDENLARNAREHTLPLAILAHCGESNAPQSVRTSYTLGFLLLCVMVDAFGEPFELCWQHPSFPIVRIAVPNMSGAESRRARTSNAHRVHFDKDSGYWSLVQPTQIVVCTLPPSVSTTTTTTTTTTTDCEMGNSGPSGARQPTQKRLKRLAVTEEEEYKKKKSRV